MPHVAVPPAPGGVRRTTTYALVAALLGLLAATTAGAATAAAQSRTGGAAAGDETAAFPGPPIERVRCRTDCAGARSARPGSVIDLRVRRAPTVERVVFLGAPGDADDVTVAPRRTTRRRVSVRVPRFAIGGPLAAVDRDGAQSPPSASVLRVGAAAGATQGTDGPAIDVEVRNPKVFFDGARGATVAYLVRGEAPASVVVRVLRGRRVVRAFKPVLAVPGVLETVTWNGTVRGKPQKPGRYRFDVAADGSVGGPASSARAGEADPEAFVLLDHQFPIRGPHDYGEGAAAFGGGRGHQGHDVFATCGTPLVAARGGRVKFKQYHSAAGNYLVIDGRGTGIDYAYMHLRGPALVDVGDRVRTGQLIGYVGDTGRASGCHLHFELWSAPGWYDGGAPFDPLPQLRAWDRTS